MDSAALSPWCTLGEIWVFLFSSARAFYSLSLSDCRGCSKGLQQRAAASTHSPTELVQRVPGWRHHHSAWSPCSQGRSCTRARHIASHTTRTCGQATGCQQGDNRAFSHALIVGARGYPRGIYIARGESKKAGGNKPCGLLSK